MKPELIVAGKEIRDHVTSRRFLIVFAILVLLSIYSVVSGMDQYNKTLDSYKENQQQDWYKQMIQSLQDQITKAQASGESQELIDSLQAQLDSYINPVMPSVMTIFYQMNLYFVYICALLAIAVGFDLITREKEEGSLKSLLSHPVYRDSVINGKSVGAITVLTLSMGAMFLLTIAIVLFFGVVPSMDDLLRIVGYFVMALLLCLVFFAIAMAASTIAKDSSTSVLYAIGILILLVGLAQFSWNIVDFIAGPAPDYGGPIIYYSNAAEGVKINVAAGSTAASSMVAVGSTGDSTNSSTPPDATEEPSDGIIGIDPIPILPGEPTGPSQEYLDWQEKRELLTKALTAISPITNFQNDIANALMSNMDYSGGGIVRPLMLDSKIAYPYTPKKTTVWDALSSVWVNILVLLAEILAAFGIAYIKFLRTDIR